MDTRRVPVPPRRRRRKRVSTAKRKERKQAKHTHARKFFLNYLSLFRNRAPPVKVTIDREPRTDYGEGYDLVGMYYDKKFLAKQVWEWWTAKIISFDETTEKYTGMYDDGYREIMKVEELAVLHLHVDPEDTIERSLEAAQAEQVPVTVDAGETACTNDIPANNNREMPGNNSEEMPANTNGEMPAKIGERVPANNSDGVPIEMAEEKNEGWAEGEREAEDNLSWVLHPEISEDEEEGAAFSENMSNAEEEDDGEGNGASSLLIPNFTTTHSF